MAGRYRLSLQRLFQVCVSAHGHVSWWEKMSIGLNHMFGNIEVHTPFKRKLICYYLDRGTRVSQVRNPNIRHEVVLLKPSGATWR